MICVVLCRLLGSNCLHQQFNCLLTITFNSHDSRTEQLILFYFCCTFFPFLFLKIYINLLGRPNIRFFTCIWAFNWACLF